MKGLFFMTKSDTGKPRSTVMWGGLNSCPITMKYLLEYFGGLQVPLGPVDIKDFVENFLHLEILSDIVDLPYIKAFIYYSPGVYFHIKSDRPISVEPGTIILNQDIEVDSPQGRFVLGHEAGHWIINRELADPVRPNYSSCKTFEMRTDYMDAEKISHYIDTDSDAWSEIKADCIANAILMPTSAFLTQSIRLMDAYGFKDERITIGEHPEAEAALISDLAETFLVPDYAVRNNLYAYGLLAKD